MCTIIFGFFLKMLLVSKKHEIVNIISMWGLTTKTKTVYNPSIDSVFNEFKEFLYI